MTKLQEALMLQKGGVVSLVGAGGKTSLMFRIAHELSSAGETVLTTSTTKIFLPTQDQCQHVIISPSFKEILGRAEYLLKDVHHISAGSGQISSSGKLVGFQPDFIDRLWNTGMFRWILAEADGAAGRPLKAPASHEPVIPLSSGWLIGIVGLDAATKPLNEKWVFRSELYAKITGLCPGEPVTEESIATAITHENGIMKHTIAESRIQKPEYKKIVFLNKADIPFGLATGQRIVEHIGKQKTKALKRVIIGNALHEPVIVEYYKFSDN